MRPTADPAEHAARWAAHGAPIPTVETEELTVPVPDGPDVRIRLHRPPVPAVGAPASAGRSSDHASEARPAAGADHAPALITFFGGGFVTGSIDDEQNRYLAARRCLAAGMVVVAVEYALAPEHRCPTPVRQGRAVLEHLRERAEELGIDPGRILLGGQSAGANIAAAVALADLDERAENAPGAHRLLLEAAVLDLSAETVDPTIPNDMGLAPAAYMRYRAMVRERYQGPDADRYDPMACPLRHPRLAALPPTLLVAAQDDPLRADAEAMHDRLRELGVPCAMTTVRGLTHDGFRAVGTDPAARLWHDVIDRALQQAVASPPAR